MQLAQVFVPQSLPFSANSTRLLLANDNMRFGEDKTLPPTQPRALYKLSHQRVPENSHKKQCPEI